LVRKIALLFILLLIVFTPGTIQGAEFNNPSPEDQVVYYLQVVELDARDVRELGLEEITLPDRGFGISYGEEILQVMAGGFPGLLRAVGKVERNEIIQISRPRLETVVGRSAGINFLEEEFSYTEAGSTLSGIELFIEPVSRKGEEVLSRISFASHPRTAELDTEIWVGPEWQPLGIVTRVFEYETASLNFKRSQTSERYLAFYVASGPPSTPEPGSQMVSAGNIDGLNSFLLEKDAPRRASSIYGSVSYDGTWIHGGWEMDWWAGDTTVVQVEGWMGRDHRYSLGVEQEVYRDSFRFGAHVKKVGRDRPYLLALGVSDRVDIGQYLQLKAGFYPIMIDFFTRQNHSPYWWVGAGLATDWASLSVKYLTMGETQEIYGRLGIMPDDPVAVALDYRTDIDSFHAIGIGLWLDLTGLY